MVEKIAGGLKRKALTKCSKWSETYRMIGGGSFPGEWTFDHHPWLREMHDTQAARNIGQKAAQMGYTEWLLNMIFFKIDIQHRDCLYILPSESDATDFSSGRFDPALESSPHLRNLFSNVKNVGHKRAGSTSLYVRGSHSRAKMKSLPVGCLCFDEVDEMTQDNIPLAFARTHGQIDPQIFLISTPTITGKGINTYFKDSTQDHFFFQCPSCKRRIELTYPESIIICGDSIHDPKVKESHLICTECKAKLSHETKKEWLKNGKFVSTFGDRDDRGFYINQLYSPTRSPVDFALFYISSLDSLTLEQELYNSLCGLPHEVKGARLTESEIQDCRRDYLKAPVPGAHVTMGVDVGKVLHYEIDMWTIEHDAMDINDKAQCRVLDEGTVQDFEQLDGLMKNYGVSYCVVDKQPETREALRFANRFWGHVSLCVYGRGINGKQLHLNDSEATVTVDRTSWLDLSLGRIRSSKIFLPKNLSTDFVSHFQSLTRVYTQDKFGNPTGKYESTGPDHAAHARNYAEIALTLATGHGTSEDIKREY